MRIELEDNKDIADEPVDKPAAEPVKFSDLSGKKKAEYIWDYYKWWIIGTIVAVILIVNFVKDYRENSKPTYLYVEMFNSYFGYDGSNTLYDDFVAEAGIDLSTERLDIQTGATLSTENFDTTMIAYQQRLIAAYAAQTIDVVIGPRNIIEGPANCDCYADLDAILPQDLKDELVDREYEFYVYDPSKDEAADPEEAQAKPYTAGIYLDNCSYLNNMGEHGAYPVAETPDDRPVLTIAANSLHTDHAIEFIRFLIHNR